MHADRRMWIFVVGGALSADVVRSAPALAHTGSPMHGLTDGVLHPLLGLDHLLAMVAVGTLAATLSRPVLVPGVFLGPMVLGGALGIAGLHLSYAEASIALSVVALGGALVAGRLVNVGVAAGLVALAGFVHGHAHGVEAPAAAHPAVYVLGFVVATATLHAMGVSLGFGVRNRAAPRAAVGALVAGLGIGLIAGLI